MEVNTCSPPDNKDKDCIFFSGGLAYKSPNPAFNGSSEPTSFNSAFPPLNNLVNNFLKLSFTLSKSFFKVFLFLLYFNSEIPFSSFFMANDKILSFFLHFRYFF